MRSADFEKIDLQALLREEAEFNDETSPNADSDLGDIEDTELVALTAKHEKLRRQVALLRSRIAESNEKSNRIVNVPFERNRPISLSVLIIGAIISGAVAAWSL